MNIINNILGSVLGAVTGTLTVLLQIPYAYYIIARDLREANYNWFSTLLLTATLGTLGVLFTTGTVLLNAIPAIFLAVRKGWNQGVIGALRMPFQFFAITNQLRDHLRPIEVGIFSKGIFAEGRVLSKIVTELTHLGKAGSLYYVNYGHHVNAEPHQLRKVKLVNEIRDLPTDGKGIISNLGLTKEEIDIFARIVDKQTELMHAHKLAIIKSGVEKTYPFDQKIWGENCLLKQYLTNEDSISLNKIYEIPTTATRKTSYEPGNDNKETVSSIPITVETKDRIITYEYEGFEAWIITQCEDINLPTVADPERLNLDTSIKMNHQNYTDDPNVKIYRGYYKGLDVDYIRRVIAAHSSLVDDKALDSSQAILQSFSKNPVGTPTVSSSAFQALSSKTRKEQMASARESFLNRVTAKKTKNDASTQPSSNVSASTESPSKRN